MKPLKTIHLDTPPFSGTVSNWDQHDLVDAPVLSEDIEQFKK